MHPLSAWTVDVSLSLSLSLSPCSSSCTDSPPLSLIFYRTFTYLCFIFICMFYHVVMRLILRNLLLLFADRQTWRGRWVQTDAVMRPIRRSRSFSRTSLVCCFLVWKAGTILFPPPPKGFHQCHWEHVIICQSTSNDLQNCVNVANTPTIRKKVVDVLHLKTVQTGSPDFLLCSCFNYWPLEVAA